MVFYTLSVEKPESVAGDYQAMPAKFGLQHTEGVARLPLVDCGDGSKPMSRRQVAKKIALCRQGKKTILETIIAQQKNYAKGVLMIMDSRDPPIEMELPAGARDPVQIPCFMISRADGQALSRAAAQDDVVIALVAGVVDMYGFGNGTKGQLGLSKAEMFVSVPRPRMVVQEKGIKTIACGSAHTIVLLDNGTLFGFGDGEEGQLGTGDTAASSAPVFIEKMAELGRVSSISCGAMHTLAAGVNLGMYSWGSNAYCQLGHSEEQPLVTEPTEVPDMADRKIKLVAGGFFHSMAVVVNYQQSDAERAEERRMRSEKLKAAMSKKGKSASTSTLPAWLQKTMGADADKEKKKEARKEKARNAQLEAELRQNRQRKDNEVRTLYTWGDGAAGQLGHGGLYTEALFLKSAPKGAVTKLRKFTVLPRPRLVEFIIDCCTTQELGMICQIAAWGSQSALLTSKGKVLTWGKGEMGRLGHGDELNRDRPTLVTGFNARGMEDEPIRQIAVGQWSMMALSRDANIYTWGSNLQGQLGLPGNEDVRPRFLAMPAVVRGASKKGIHQICCGDTHVGGVTENGEVYLWGQDEGGRLGHESPDPDDPAAIKWVPQASKEMAGVEVGFLDMGSSHTMAISTRYPSDDTVGAKVASSVMVVPGAEVSAGLDLVSCCCSIC